MDNQQAKGQYLETVRENIRKAAELNIAFLLMNVLAATIASYGLFANSPAVIIGAMIVAMLLGPIAGIALALVESDMKLLQHSFITLLVGTTVVMLTAFIIGLCHRDIPITREILSRTAPNLIDLMVALAGGAAGAYASVSPRLGTALVGVAIATALVPPLASASILFAHGELRLGAGAFFLTFTNMVAIQFASSVVLWLTGFRNVSTALGLSASAFIKRNAVSIVILLALAFVLTGSLHRTIEEQLFQTTARYTLTKIIDSSPGSHLADVWFEKVSDNASAEKIIVRAVVRGPSPPSPGQIGNMEAQIPPPPGSAAVELRIRFVQTDIFTRNGQLYKDTKFRDRE
jgi:uncharacterized hydrophobic protein (TIGR00271 family)